MCPFKPIECVINGHFNTNTKKYRCIYKFGIRMRASDAILPFIYSSCNVLVSRGSLGVLGIWGEWLFIFRELGSTCNCFRGAREQAHSFGDLGSKKIRKSLHFF